MANPIYSTEKSNTNYQAMSSPPSAVGMDNTTSVFDSHAPKNLGRLEEGKNQEGAVSIKARADQLLDSGKNAFGTDKTYSGYLQLLEAKRLYEQLPKDQSYNYNIIRSYYNLAATAVKIRGERKSIAEGCATTNFLVIGFSLVGFGIFGTPCAVYRCCQLKNSEWVDKDTLQDYLNKGISLTKQYIQQINNDNHIQMSTEKKDLSDQIRKDLGWAYNIMGLFYELTEYRSHNGFVSSCCLKGEGPADNASLYSRPDAVANYKLAAEWNPTNIDYSANYQRLDSAMKAPIIHNTYYNR